MLRKRNKERICGSTWMIETVSGRTLCRRRASTVLRRIIGGIVGFHVSVRRVVRIDRISRSVLGLLSLFASAAYPSALEGSEKGLSSLSNRGISMMMMMMLMLMMGWLTTMMVTGHLRRTTARGWRIFTLVQSKLRGTSR